MHNLDLPGRDEKDDDVLHFISAHQFIWIQSTFFRYYSTATIFQGEKSICIESL